jgi:tRNA G26 N,N-dimethylase Trm1
MLPPIRLAYKLYNSVVLTCSLLSDLHTNCTILWSLHATSCQNCTQTVQFCGPYLLPPVRISHKLYNSVTLTCYLLSDLHTDYTILWPLHATSCQACTQTVQFCGPYMLPPLRLAHKLYNSVALTCYLLSDLHTNCTILWSLHATSCQTCTQTVQFCGPYMFSPISSNVRLSWEELLCPLQL